MRMMKLKPRNNRDDIGDVYVNPANVLYVMDRGEYAEVTLLDGSHFHVRANVKEFLEDFEKSMVRE